MADSDTNGLLPNPNQTGQAYSLVAQQPLPMTAPPIQNPGYNQVEPQVAPSRQFALASPSSAPPQVNAFQQPTGDPGPAPSYTLNNPQTGAPQQVLPVMQYAPTQLDPSWQQTNDMQHKLLDRYLQKELDGKGKISSIVAGLGGAAAGLLLGKSGQGIQSYLQSRDQDETRMLQRLNSFANITNTLGYKPAAQLAKEEYQANKQKADAQKQTDLQNYRTGVMAQKDKTHADLVAHRNNMEYLKGLGMQINDEHFTKAQDATLKYHDQVDQRARQLAGVDHSIRLYGINSQLAAKKATLMADQQRDKDKLDASIAEHNNYMTTKIGELNAKGTVDPRTGKPFDVNQFMINYGAPTPVQMAAPAPEEPTAEELNAARYSLANPQPQPQQAPQGAPVQQPPSQLQAPIPAQPSPAQQGLNQFVQNARPQQSNQAIPEIVTFAKAAQTRARQLGMGRLETARKFAEALIQKGWAKSEDEAFKMMEQAF